MSKAGKYDVYLEELEEELEDIAEGFVDTVFDRVRPNIDYGAAQEGRRLSEEHRGKIVDYICWIQYMREGMKGTMDRLEDDCVGEMFMLSYNLPREDLKIAQREVSLNLQRD